MNPETVSKSILQQALQRTRPVPPKLGEIMEAVNGVPEDALDWSEIESYAKEFDSKGIRVWEFPLLMSYVQTWEFPEGFKKGRYKPEHGVSSTDAMVTLFLDALDHLLPVAREYVGSPYSKAPGELFIIVRTRNESHWKFQESAGRYDLIVRASRALRQIARIDWDKTTDFLKRWQAIPLTTEDDEPLKRRTIIPSLFWEQRNEQASLFLKISVFTNIGLIEWKKEKEEIIQARPDPLLEIIEGLEARRIRECAVCNKIFWAGRKDAKCCSGRCANLRRVHLSRSNKQKYGHLYEAALAKRERMRK